MIIYKENKLDRTATTCAKSSPEQVIAQDSFSVSQTIMEHSFPIEFVLAGELAQMETFAIPRISSLLHRTRQYEHEGLKRLDDTKATVYGIFSNEPESRDRKQMVEHLNWVHSHYDIHNDDNIYTLIRMFMHPIEWIEKWGRRALSTQEKEALVSELVRISGEMNIHDMPTSYDAMRAWQDQYRMKHQHYHSDNLAVSEGMMEGIRQHFPRWLRPFIKPTVLVLLDNEALLEALGYKQPGLITKGIVHAGLRAWKLLSKIYNPWRNAKFSEGWFLSYFPSYEGDEYPNGFELCKLGPKKLLAARDKRGACPFH